VHSNNRLTVVSGTLGQKEIVDETSRRQGQPTTGNASGRAARRSDSDERIQRFSTNTCSRFRQSNGSSHESRFCETNPARLTNVHNRRSDAERSTSGVKSLRNEPSATSNDSIPTNEPNAASRHSIPTNEPNSIRRHTTLTNEPNSIGDDAFSTNEPNSIGDDAIPTNEPNSANRHSIPTNEPNPIRDDTILSVPGRRWSRARRSAQIGWLFPAHWLHVIIKGQFEDRFPSVYPEEPSQ
jgi:hypothetical protein